MSEAPVPTTALTHRPGLPKRVRILVPVVLLVAIAVGVRRFVLQPAPEAGLRLSGRIEGYEANVGAKVGGRIEAIAVREGDVVTKGQVIAQLDDAEIQASLLGATASVTAAEQQLSQAQLQISVIESQIQEAQLTQFQAEDDAAGRANAARATVASAVAQEAQAQAQVKQLEAEVRLAKADRDRFDSLARDGVVSRQRFDQAQTAYDSLQETLQARRAAQAAAQEQVNVAQGSLTQSSASRLNPEIRSSQVQRFQTQLAQAQSQLKAAAAGVENAKASRSEIEARLDQLEIVSPLDGIVLTRTTEPGEVISSGKTVLTVINLEAVFLRGYIPEQDIGLVRVGQDAEVFLDSAPEQPLAATVSAIDSEASFTPENIYFRDDRVTQVFGLKLSLENAAGFAKPGMPADAKILTDGATQ